MAAEPIGSLSKGADVNYIKEFVYPFLPVIFELFCRIIFQRLDNWAFYVSPTTIFVTFAIWSSLTSLRVPENSPVDTDVDYAKSLSMLRQSIMIMGMFGFMCFGAFVFGDAALSLSDPALAGLRNYIQIVFCLISIAYAAVVLIYILYNKQNIEELYRV